MVVDYYALLEVEPGADPSAIEAAIRRLQPIWSAQTRHPSRGTRYQSQLESIPEIRRRLLGSKVERALYDAELASRHRADREGRLNTLQRLVRLRAAKGGLTVQDRQQLRVEADRLGLGPR